MSVPFTFIFISVIPLYKFNSSPKNQWIVGIKLGKRYRLAGKWDELHACIDRHAYPEV